MSSFQKTNHYLYETLDIKTVKSTNRRLDRQFIDFDRILLDALVALVSYLNYQSQFFFHCL